MYSSIESFVAAQTKINDYMLKFMELIAHPIIEMDSIYNQCYKLFLECYNSDKSYFSILSFNPEYALYEVKYDYEPEGATKNQGALAISLAQKLIKSDMVTVVDKNTLSEMYLVRNVPEKAIIARINLDGQYVGALVIYTFETKYDYLYDELNKPALAFLTYVLSLANHKKSYNNRVNSLIYNDQLTQLPNRTHITEILVSAMQSADFSSCMLSLLMVGIDGIKNINDTLGYDVGDFVIKQVGKKIKSVVGDDCPVARFGGDDFAVLLPNIASTDQVYKTCNAILSSMNAPIYFGVHVLNVTVSIGISIFPHNGDSTDSIIRNADTAMNQSKKDGRSSYKFYSEAMTEESGKELFLQNQLKNAIDNDEFELYYQGQLDLFADRIDSVEALIRWIHPEKGVLLPYDFISFAEENNMIIPIDKIVIRKACRQAKDWSERGLNTVVGINVSPEHFKNGDIVKAVEDALLEFDLSPSLIKIEILESALIEDLSYTIQVINDLKAIGVGVSLDDFGSGYSSLEYITTLPLDTIKIDRAFTMKLEENPNNKIIVKTIIALAKEMGLSVTAEGVEKQSHADFLKEQGCDCAQGYFINRPLPVDEMEKLIYKYNNVEDDFSFLLDFESFN